MNEPVIDTTLNVLVASGDTPLLELAQRALAAQGDRVTMAMGVAEAIATAQVERFDLAFVDLTLDGDAGLALVHHLGAITAGIVVHVIVPREKLEIATEAVSLGASGIHLLPLAGDELATAASEVRTRLFEARRREELEWQLERMRRRSDLLDRLIRLARGSGQSDAVRVITEAFAEATEARGVALYAAFDGQNAECVRLATNGSARDMPAVARMEELAKTFELRRAHPISLKGSHGLLGIVAIEGGPPEVEREMGTLIELATVVLALVDSRRPRGQSMKDDRGRVYTLAYLHDIGAHEIDKAKRHGRRLSILCIDIVDADRIARVELEDIVQQVVRDSDVVAVQPPGEYYLLLPETGTLGAHSCRRRLLVRAEGDRRSKTASAASDRRGPVRRASPIAIGVASFPHDGGSLDRLMRLARSRAHAQARSAVHALSLAPLALPEVVDALLAKPILDIGPSSPSPLELATPAMLSLVGQACREARRGGAAALMVTVQPGAGMASAVRQAVRDAKDVTVRTVDARAAQSCGDLEAIVVEAEHGSWVCCGRTTRDRFRGVHAADPLLCDLVAHRLAQAGGVRGP
jgi:ActR/RegA family two-component response regulator